ncbi:MAG: hypothetical protein EXR86_05040 [Gammaproteobacteria bacterium]|nr:hypothetical protein [Gammaproteobacteria bacterium]
MRPTDLPVPAATGTRRERAPAIWIFIALDCSSFGLFFLVFMAERLGKATLFDQSAQQLNAGLGFLNACILITSSWLVACGLGECRRAQRRFSRSALSAANEHGNCGLFWHMVDLLWILIFSLLHLIGAR